VRGSAARGPVARTCLSTRTKTGDKGFI
jgi:hypothetical protein